jgi:hypothetical protein
MYTVQYSAAIAAVAAAAATTTLIIHSRHTLRTHAKHYSTVLAAISYSYSSLQSFELRLDTERYLKGYANATFVA